MICTFCSSENTRVLESRLSCEKTSIRRRRKCESCNRRFTTYERVETCPVAVIKKDRSREKFSREKLMKSIINSCLKTNISPNLIEKIVENIEYEIVMTGKKEISSNYLGNKTLEHLQEANEIAYLRYLSAFKECGDIKELFNEIGISAKTPTLV